MAAHATVEPHARTVDNAGSSPRVGDGRSACKHCDEGRAGYAPGRPGDVARDVPACKRPRRHACDRCPAFLVLPCENSATAVCEPCGLRYRRRVQVVALDGCGVDVATAAQALDGDQESVEALGALAAAQGVFTTLVFTLTAPGNHQHRDRTKPGAPWCKCTKPGGVDLAAWNGQQGERWNRFMQDLRRSGLLGEVVQYFRAVEVQDGKRRLDGRGRQALHEHVLVRLAEVVQVDRALVEQLRALAIKHEYGHELVVERPVISQDGRARLAAWYAAKYVSKAADVRGVVPWQRRHLGDRARTVEHVDRWTGEVTTETVVEPYFSPATYRTWTSSRGWGCSMRVVKERQRAWAVLTAHDGGCVVLTSTGEPAPPRQPAGPEPAD